MSLHAAEYEILRNVKTSCLNKIPLARKPVRVATLMNEKRFVECDGLMTHLDTVFFEDRVHDWDWRDGTFRFYSRVGEFCDVVVVYSLEEQTYDPMTGKPNPRTKIS